MEPLEFSYNRTYRRGLSTTTFQLTGPIRLVESFEAKLLRVSLSWPRNGLCMDTSTPNPDQTRTATGRFYSEYTDDTNRFMEALATIIADLKEENIRLSANELVDPEVTRQVEDILLAVRATMTPEQQAVLDHMYRSQSAISAN